VENKADMLAYFCCFRYQDNIYASIGGGNPKFFAYKASNKLYDELIRYACDNGLSVHVGIGERGSGYQKFKQNAGLTNYQTERFPDDEALLARVLPLLRLRLTGLGLAAVSRCLPYRVPYLAMPFT
jgi:hypothetical protein